MRKGIEENERNDGKKTAGRKKEQKEERKVGGKGV